MKVGLVANSTWFIYQFHMPLIREIRGRGWQLGVVAPRGPEADHLESSGATVIDWRMSRRNLGLRKELRALRSLTSIISRERFDVVHSFTVKGNIWTNLAASYVGTPRVVNSWEGLGWLWSCRDLRARIYRAGVTRLARIGADMARPYSFVLNQHDYETLRTAGILDVGRAEVLPSVGVDLDVFHAKKTELDVRNGNICKIVYAGRLLWSKGVGQLVRMASEFEERGVSARVVIAGTPDPESRDSVPESVLAKWRREQRSVDLLGYVRNVPELLVDCDLAVYPTQYGEGVPRFLVEAAAAGLPVIAYDAPGCATVVKDGVNGFLVPMGEYGTLRDYVELLVRDCTCRTTMGESSRQIALAFDASRIVPRIVAAYNW